MKSILGIVVASVLAAQSFGGPLDRSTTTADVADELENALRKLGEIPWLEYLAKKKAIGAPAMAEAFRTLCDWKIQALKRGEWSPTLEIAFQKQMIQMDKEAARIEAEIYKAQHPDVVIIIEP